ncbi:MAG TPA: phosphohydrolase [Firmicutes bacterium]|jgi:putative nucleotidyltransferase with HDIG domain|nr:phosphohydrolase [Bacillota bacterium]HCF88605.1 phosphohydrolase [Bacillota bacterium]HCF91239.1 phosphohydrolase [Bacillota bacterium]HCM18557.1 phosphohydrolase [Bacillota bacterium]HCT35555.1 phosphohydrolase [Bacillota bacterium]
MNREAAWALVEEQIANANLRKHVLAVEAVMRKLADHFGEDAEKWGLAGLLHDIDYDETAKDPERHSMIGADLLAELGVAADIVYAVRVHNETHGLPRLTLMDKALHASDPLTGLITSAALIKPEKMLCAIDAEFVMKRFNEKSFARGANRDQIRRCDELGLELDEFIAIGVEAMQEIAPALGL